MPARTELDALLERVREDKADPSGKNRNTVAYDCWRMFEDLATRYIEEYAMRDRYKRQSNSWRDTALRLHSQLHALVDSAVFTRDVYAVDENLLEQAKAELANIRGEE